MLIHVRIDNTCTPAILETTAIERARAETRMLTAIEKNSPSAGVSRNLNNSRTTSNAAEEIQAVSKDASNAKTMYHAEEKNGAGIPKITSDDSSKKRSISLSNT
jgi:hypothetical protein